MPREGSYDYARLARRRDPKFPTGRRLMDRRRAITTQHKTAHPRDPPASRSRWQPERASIATGFRSMTSSDELNPPTRGAGLLGTATQLSSSSPINILLTHPHTLALSSSLHLRRALASIFPTDQTLAKKSRKPHRRKEHDDCTSHMGRGTLLLLLALAAAAAAAARPFSSAAGTGVSSTNPASTDSAVVRGLGKVADASKADQLKPRRGRSVYT